MRKLILTIALAALIISAGCTDVKGDDYGDAPDEIKGESLDYQDYKEADCPYLDQSLDQETMKKCNKWIRENNVTTS